MAIRTVNHFPTPQITHGKYLAGFWIRLCRSSPSEVFLGKGVLKLCIKFTREQPYQNVISIKLLYNFIEIALRHGCSPVNLQHILRTPFQKNTSGWLLLALSLMTEPNYCWIYFKICFEWKHDKHCKKPQKLFRGNFKFCSTRSLQDSTFHTTLAVTWERFGYK